MRLTEQWKKGELPCGHYYVIFDKNDTPEISRCVYKVITLSKPEVRDFEDFGVEKVLAPVPGYEEWQETDFGTTYIETVKTKQENQQLKELLINAKDIIEWYSTESGYIDLPTKDLLNKINNIIGEK